MRRLAILRWFMILLFVLIPCQSSGEAQTKNAHGKADVNSRRKQTQSIDRARLDELLRENDRAKVLLEYERLTSLDSDNSALRYEYGMYLAKSGERSSMEKAISFLQKAAQSEPDNPMFCRGLAIQLLKQRKFQEALLWFKRAAEHGNESDRVFYRKLDSGLRQKHTDLPPA